MVLRRAPAVRRPFRVITAAAEKIDLTDRKGLARLNKSRQQWQAEAITYFDALGEIKYYVRFKGNAMSRMRPFIGSMEPDEDMPVPAEDSTLPDNLIAAAKDEMARLFAGDDGPAEMLRSAAMNLEVVGECWLIGQRDPLGEEDFRIHSIVEVLVNTSGRMEIRATPDGKGVELGEDSSALRIWTRHPMWRLLPDSAMRGILEIAEELLILNRTIRSAARSRVASAGFLKVPDGLILGSVNRTADSGDGEGTDEPFTADLVEAMLTAIQDEGSAAAAVPVIVRGEASELAQFDVVLLDRPLDPIFAEQRKELITRIAQGLDAPPELLTGSADINHWGAWQVDESTFKSHIEPAAISIFDALSAGFLRPALEARNEFDPVDIDRVVMWYDPTELVTHPNQAQAAKDAYDRDALSWEAYNRYNGFTEADRPDAGELMLRAFLKRPQFDPATGPQLIERILGPIMAPVGLPPAVEANGTPISPVAPETVAPGPAQTPPPGIQASARQPVGMRMVEIDRHLRERLLFAADAALRRALEKAGSRLRSRMGRNSTERAATQRVDLSAVVATLGPTLVAALGSSEDELLEEAFGGLESSFRSWTTVAQRRALDLAAEVVPLTGRTALEARQATDLDEAWAWFHDALMGLARQRLYEPSVPTPGRGEFDETMSVPAAMVRQAVARAGGAKGIISTPDGGAFVALEESGNRPLGGIATGDLIRDTISAEGGGIEGYVWVYGPAIRTRPFEPHEIDGTEFVNFDDDALINEEGWPDAFVMPGDHSGCVPAGTLVSGQMPRGATLRWYEGELVELGFASGDFLSATPNHPVLTRQGWVAAGLLEEGDEVVRCVDTDSVADLIPDDRQVPTPIEEVVGSFGEALGVQARGVKVAAEDFHGDGIDGQVAVVWSDRFLGDAGVTTLAQPAGEEQLGLRTMPIGVGFSGLSATGSDGERIGPTSLGGVGSLGHGHTLLGRAQSGEPDLHFARSPGRDAPPSETVVDRVPIDAEMLGQSLDAVTGLVEFDKLVAINRHLVACHVYNLETSCGWYLANATIVHNCGCDVAPIIIGPSEATTSGFAPGEES